MRPRLCLIALVLMMTLVTTAEGAVTPTRPKAPSTAKSSVVDPITLTSESPVTVGGAKAATPRKSLTPAKTSKARKIEARPAATAVTLPASKMEAPRFAPIREFTATVSLGLDMRGERDQKQSTVPRAWPTLSLGVGVKPWLALLEYASFSENSGNNALNVQRKVESLLLWGQWAPDENWVVQPYFGLGFGGYRTSAELTLYSEKNSTQGKWIEHGAGALGLRLMKLSPFLVAVEGRVHMNRELDPSPTLSGMLKLGFILE